MKYVIKILQKIFGEEAIITINPEQVEKSLIMKVDFLGNTTKIIKYIKKLKKLKCVESYSFNPLQSNNFNTLQSNIQCTVWFLKKDLNKKLRKKKLKRIIK